MHIGRAWSILLMGAAAGGAAPAVTHAQDEAGQAARRAAIQREVQSESFALELRQSQGQGVERWRIEALPMEERERLELRRDQQRRRAGAVQDRARPVQDHARAVQPRTDTWTPTLERPPRRWTPSLQ
jgi:hypothetical protein